MANIIKEQPTPKFSHNSIKTDKKISFNFSYIINSSHFGWKGMDSNKAKKKNINTERKASLMDKIKEISDYTFSELLSFNKDRGCELMEGSYFSKPLQDALNSIEITSKDEKYVIFRFGKKNEYRLICSKQALSNNILTIVAFDFNFDAYNHGN